MTIRAIVRPIVRPIVRAIVGALGVFSPSFLFANGEQGVWYDPSDFSSLFQDAAGTIPVTAVEQPVGRILDKSGRGNHATQVTAASRPVVSARKNILLNTPFNDGVTGTPGTAPTNWSTGFATGSYDSFAGDTVVMSVASAGRHFLISQNIVLGPNETVTGSFMVNAVTGNPADTVSNFNVSAGTIVTSNTITVASGVGRKSYIVTAGAGGATVQLRVGLGTIVSTVGAASISVSEPQVERDGLIGRYQRVNTATDYDAVEFPKYELFDGVDDSLAAATGGGSSTSAFICIGFRQITNGASNVIWSDRTGNTGLKLEVTAGGLIAFSGGNGAAIITATGAAVTLNTDYVVTATYDGVNLSIQLNNGAATTAACVLVAGTAGFTIAKDNGAATGFLNGRIYEVVYVKDDLPSASRIDDAKQYVAGMSEVTL